MTFKPGQRVKLTGTEWADAFPPHELNTVTIEDVDDSGAYKFVDEAGWWYNDPDEGWGMELNSDTPAEHFAKQKTGSFEQNVRRILSGIADTVSSKNLAYGDSALNPVRIFSKADRMEQLFVRLDDKLSRVQRGHEYPGDDTIRDIIGYCTLILIARESN